jgi:hypothetical protein
MRRVECDVEVIEMDGEHTTVEGVQATCRRCGAETESYGTSERSIRRCMVLLREQCPMNEDNYYVPATNEEDS